MMSVSSGSGWEFAWQNWEFQTKYTNPTSQGRLSGDAEDYYSIPNLHEVDSIITFKQPETPPSGTDFFREHSSEVVTKLLMRESTEEWREGQKINPQLRCRD